MAHIYMRFNFDSGEEAAQQARHKLDTWKQAFRLDKKLLYKLDRAEATGDEESAESPDSENANKHPQPAKAKAKPEAKAKAKSAATDNDTVKSGDANANVTLLVRLYFSSHEKLSEQRWIDRIPSEEPFKSASPKIIGRDDPEFAQVVKEFEDLQ